jgi:hypothetical protein
MKQTITRKINKFSQKWPKTKIDWHKEKSKNYRHKRLWWFQWNNHFREIRTQHVLVTAGKSSQVQNMFWTSHRSGLTYTCTYIRSQNKNDFLLLRNNAFLLWQGWKWLRFVWPTWRYCMPSNSNLHKAVLLDKPWQNPWASPTGMQK